jgi:hypothetical protein
VAAGQLGALVVQQGELAEEQVHHRQVVLVAGDVRGQVPADGPAHPAGQGEQVAHDDLAAVDPVPLVLQLPWAAAHEHLQLRRQAVHAFVQAGHGGLLGCPPAVGGVGPTGEGGGQGGLHGRDRLGIQVGPGGVVLAGDQRLLVAVGAHQPAGGLDVGRDAGGLAVQVQVEQVEVVAAVAQQDVEELPVGAVGRALGQPERGAAEHHRRLRVGRLDRPVHHLQLGDVLGRGAGPQQADVGGLVVALPVPDPPAAVAHQAVHEPAVVLRVPGRRRRQELGRLPGRPPRAGADGDPDLLGPVQLVEEGVHGVEVVPAGLGLDLGPVEVDPDQPCPERAELG